MASISKMVSVAVLCAVVLLMASTAIPARSGEDDAVNGVAAVHHSDPGGIPRGSDTRTMLASYYDRTLEGSPMANGRPFDADDYTAAHKTLPFGTELAVRHDGEAVRVTVTDRGPYVAGRDLDLSLAAAREIGLAGAGEALVRVEVL